MSNSPYVRGKLIHPVWQIRSRGWIISVGSTYPVFLCVKVWHSVQNCKVHKMVPASNNQIVTHSPPPAPFYIIMYICTYYVPVLCSMLIVFCDPKCVGAYFSPVCEFLCVQYVVTYCSTSYSCKCFASCIGCSCWSLLCCRC